MSAPLHWRAPVEARGITWRSCSPTIRTNIVESHSISLQIGGNKPTRRRRARDQVILVIERVSKYNGPQRRCLVVGLLRGPRWRVSPTGSKGWKIVLARADRWRSKKRAVGGLRVRSSVGVAIVGKGIRGSAIGEHLVDVSMSIATLVYARDARCDRGHRLVRNRISCVEVKDRTERGLGLRMLPTRSETLDYEGTWAGSAGAPRKHQNVTKKLITLCKSAFNVEFLVTCYFSTHPRAFILNGTWIPESFQKQELHQESWRSPHLSSPFMFNEVRTPS